MTAVNGGPFDGRRSRPTTFFSAMTSRYQMIRDEEKLDTQTFLKASREILPFFDHLGAAFKFVKYDISGNIEKLQKNYNLDTKKFQFIDDMLEDDSKNKTSRSAEPLLWLIRGLHFVEMLLQMLAESLRDGNSEEDLSIILDVCYDTILKRYHGWVIQKLVTLCFKAVPRRQDVVDLLSLKQSGIQDILVEDVFTYTLEIKPNLERVNYLYDKYDLHSEKKTK